MSVWGNLYGGLCFINGIEISQTVMAWYCTNIWKYLADGLLKLSATNKRHKAPSQNKIAHRRFIYQ